jgi:hypothetical protein
MSNSFDTAITIALFVLGALLVVFFGVSGLMRLGVEIEPQPAQPSRLDNALRVAGEVIPPLLLAGAYLAAIVLAGLTSGLTFYYPVVAVLIGVVAWDVSLKTVSRRLRHLRSGEKTVQDVLREKAHRREQQRYPGQASDAEGKADGN